MCISSNSFRFLTPFSEVLTKNEKAGQTKHSDLKILKVFIVLIINTVSGCNYICMLLLNHSLKNPKFKYLIRKKLDSGYEKRVGDG